MSEQNPTPAIAPAAAGPAAPAPGSQPVAGTEPSAALSQPQPGNPAPITGRPETVPEQFWDPEKNTIKAEELVKAYMPLAEQRAAEEARLAAYPKAAKDIPLVIPDGIAPKGVKIELDETNPLVEPARELIFAKKLDPELLNDFAGIFVKQQLTEQKELETARTAQMQKLGDNAGARIDAVKTFIKKFGGPDAEAVSEHIFTAKQYGVYEKLMQAFSAQNAQPAPAGAGGHPAGNSPKPERRIGDGWYDQPQQKAS